MDHEHDCHDEECEVCKKGLEAMRIWEDECMQKHGWYVHAVCDGDHDCPYGQNMHTHGIPITFPGAFDVQICLPPSIPRDVCHNFLSSYVDLLRKGKRLRHGDAVEGIIKGHLVLFARAEEDDRELLRMILPDERGAFKKGEISGGLEEQWLGADDVLDVRVVPIEGRATPR